VTYVTASYCFA